MERRDFFAQPMIIVILLAAGIVFLFPVILFAHCDTMDGPVVVEAQKALDKDDIAPVLKWVHPEQEAELRAAFEQCTQVRTLSGEARNLADHYFFETLVRLHRAAEGAPYDGIKPAGKQEPIIVAADNALASGSVDALTKEVAEAVTTGIRERFEHARETAAHAEHSVEMGREYVKAYVEFVHYVEGLHQDAHSAAHEHTPQARPEVEHQH